jgi:hypothetical protein
MRELANRLKRLGCINRDIRLAVAMTGPNCDQLLTLRADFSFESNQLLNQLTGKLVQTDQARLASRILDAFVSMQQVISSHQQKWSLAEVGRDPDGYIARSRQVQDCVIHFLEEALDQVDEAEMAARALQARHSPDAAPIRLIATQ